MAQLAVIKKASDGFVPMSQYNQSKWSLGHLIKRRTDLGTPFIGPVVNTVGRPVETSAAMPGVFPHVIQWANKNSRYSTGTVTVAGTAVTGNGTAWLSGGIAVGTRIGFSTNNPDAVTSWYTIDSITDDTHLVLSTSAGSIGSGASYVIENFKQIDWVFLADNASAAATRRIQLYEFDRNAGTMAWKGFITLTMNAGGNQQIRGFRMLYNTYSVGTVQVATATVTGTNTLWQTNKRVAGNTLMSHRIGFGSTDPTQIKTWYYINTITAEGTMTISTSQASNIAANITVAAGSAYVIEDLSALVVTTCATATNGGMFIAKGLSYADFLQAGTTIAYAASTDNIKEVVWLKDNATQANTNACGIAIEPITDWSTQIVYIIDVATVKIYKHNVRAALTIASGNTVNTWLLSTGSQAVTGTIAQNNNGRYGVLNHGPASGLPAIYFVTTTRIYCVKIASITSGNTSFLDYQMTEVPPGTVNTIGATGALACIEIAGTIDRLVVTSTGASGARSYVTQFRTDGGQIDHIFLIDDKQIDQASVDGNTVPHPSILAVIQTPWAEDGMLYLAGVGTTALTNLLHSVPIGVDWAYTSLHNQVAITPEMPTPNCVKFITPFVIRDNYIGNEIIGKRTDAMRISFRTSGISDNSGGWTALSEPYDMSGVAGANSIQFRIEFKGITDFCVPARIFSIGIAYEDASTDSHYRFSGTLSSAVSKSFAFRFSTTFGSTVPRLRIRLYNDVTNALLLDDDSTTQAATWQKSTNDGTGWGSYDTSDKGNETTYIRVTYATLGDNIKVRAVLTLY
jgi:hypothetical protein